MHSVKTLLTLLAAAMLALPAPACCEVLENDYYKIDMPDTWQRLQEDVSTSVAIHVYATRNRDTVMTTIISTSGGADLATITRSFAQQYKAGGRTSVKNNMGTFSYVSSSEVDSYGYVTLQDNVYMVVTVSGNLRKARQFMKCFSSQDYDALLPGF